MGVMVFKATFNNISAISWWSALLVGETGKHHLASNEISNSNECDNMNSPGKIVSEAQGNDQHCMVRVCHP